MNKLFGTNLRRLLNLLFLKARFQAGLFARVGDYVPRFRLQCLCPETTFPVSVCACIRSMVMFELRDCAELTMAAMLSSFAWVRLAIGLRTPVTNPEAIGLVKTGNCNHASR